MLVHVVDVAGSEGRDPKEDFEMCIRDRAKGDVDFARLFKVGAVLAICIVVSALFQWIMTYNSNTVSYTHLDVYKRQAPYEPAHQILSSLWSI